MLTLQVVSLVVQRDTINVSVFFNTPVPRVYGTEAHAGFSV